MSEVACNITPTTGAAIASAAADELSPADHAVNTRLDQPVDTIEVGRSIAIPIRTGGEFDHYESLLLAVSPVR